VGYLLGRLVVLRVVRRIRRSDVVSAAVVSEIVASAVGGDDPDVVVAFTATQIPHIDRRRYPPELAGPRYPGGIPVVPESTLDSLIKTQAVDEVVFAYSDVSHEYVMHQASRVLAAGADFRLMGINSTAVPCSVPVISILATRTGAGKSPTSRFIASLIMGRGLQPAVIRHPMPYGDLVAQRVQRFAAMADLDRAQATVEEREDYEPHIRRGLVVWAGVDYEAIVREADLPKLLKALDELGYTVKSD
jgi:predicted GTPase